MKMINSQVALSDEYSSIHEGLTITANFPSIFTSDQTFHKTSNHPVQSNNNQLYPQMTYQLNQQHTSPKFKSINISSDEIISPLSNSSSTSSSSSSSCSSSFSSGMNHSVTFNGSRFAANMSKKNTVSPTYPNQTSNRKINTKKRPMQSTSELDEERTNQLVSDLLRNIKEKTRELESLNQNLKSNLNNNLNSQEQLGISLTTDQNTYPTVSPLPSIETTNSIPHQRAKSKSRRVIKSGAIFKEITVPEGWTRTIVNSQSVVYTNPVGTQFKSIEEIRAYLLTDNTCKCGLECPLNVNKTFNFDSSVVLHNSTNKRTDVTILSGNNTSSCCNHKFTYLNESLTKSRIKRTKLPKNNHKTSYAPNALLSATLEPANNSLELLGDKNIFENETVTTNLLNNLNHQVSNGNRICNDDMMIELGDLNDSLPNTNLEGSDLTNKEITKNDLGFFDYEDKTKQVNDKSYNELNISDENQFNSSYNNNNTKLSLNLTEIFQMIQNSTDI